MAAETNLIQKADLARVREVEFAYSFENDIRKLNEILGVTRLIPKQAGAALKAYKASGTLDTGVVAEGDTIPLSKYKTEAITIKEIVPKKWRKATSAESIIERGYDQAVTMITDKMLSDAQKVIRKEFADFLSTGTGTTSGATFQSALANAWGKLQILFEDTSISSVYFMNPMDVAGYLGTANVSMQTAFGMSYMENFLGLGTVILLSDIPSGTIYATAKENIVGYYIPVNGADLGEAFEFTSDESGLIGIHEAPDYTNMTVMDTVVTGVTLFAERLDGVVIATISGE